MPHPAPPSFPFSPRSRYAICYTSELAALEAGEAYPTRLFGEPLTLRRDAQGQVACTSAAPGAADVAYAVADHQGLIYLWRGDPDAADRSLLPTHPEPEMTHAVETILDYGCDWTYIVENNLDTPHLYWLHDGSIPPIESLGCNRNNVGKIGLRFFTDDVGVGHIGKTSKKVTKVVRYDAPNIVRHGGVSGFSEEFNIIPVGPHRTRVLLRQRFPKGPILSTLLGIPGFSNLLTYLVRSWNYQIGLEDYSVMQGQAHNINDLGAPNYDQLGTGDDLIVKFWQWKRAASARDAGSAEAVLAAHVDSAPEYFTRWDGSTVEVAQAQQAAAAAAGAQAADLEPVHPVPQNDLQYLRPHYQQQPVAAYPPVNHAYPPFEWYKRVALPEVSDLAGLYAQARRLPQIGAASLSAFFAARMATASPEEMESALGHAHGVLQDTSVLLSAVLERSAL